MNKITEASAILRDEGMASLGRATRSFLRRALESQIYPRINERLLRYRYGSASPDPTQLLMIDPTNVEYLISPHFWTRVSRFTTHVKGGEWDRRYASHTVMFSGRQEGLEEQRLIPLSNFELYRSCLAHFHEGVPWKETDLYAFLRENGEIYWKTDHEEKVDQTLRNLDTLYETMEEHGYLRQSELGRGNDPVDTLSDNTIFSPNLHEVAVNIGRDGELIFDDGRHRFVIANILGLNEIPVRVLVRHEEWQQIRGHILAKGSPKKINNEYHEYLDHPDIRGATVGSEEGA